MAKRSKVPDLSPDTPLAEAARRLIVARLADVRMHESEVLAEDPKEDPVHDLRVGARRLSTALALLGDKKLRKLRDDVEALKDALGPVRDLHVQGSWLAKRDRRLAKLHAVGAGDKITALQKKLVHFQRKVAPAIDVSAGVLERKGTLGGDKVQRRLRRFLEKTDARVAAALEDFTPARIHAVRIAAKKLRYALELVQGGIAAAEPVLRVLEPLQEQLGDLRDLDARIELLEEMEAPARLVAGVRRERAKLAPSVRQSLQRWRESGTVAALRA